MAHDLPQPAELDNPLLGFRFGVYFLSKDTVDHNLDFRFQSVSGLSVTVGFGASTTKGYSASGDGMLPESLTYGKLLLKRGYPKESALRAEIQQSFEEFQFRSRMVLVVLLDEQGEPLQSWQCMEAIPTKWSLGNFDATSSAVLIEDLELTYKQLQPISL